MLGRVRFSELLGRLTNSGPEEIGLTGKTGWVFRESSSRGTTSVSTETPTRRTALRWPRQRVKSSGTPQ